MTIGGERAGLHEDAPPRTARPIECGEHQMQVDCQRAHRHDFAGARAGEGREAVTEVFVVRNPRPAPVLVSEDRELRPVIQLLHDHPPGGERHQSERVPAEVHERRQGELLP